MSALDDVLDLAQQDKRQNGYTFFNSRGLIKSARAELAALRAADIRTMEHCDDCGGLLVLVADAPEDTEPFCPSCELEKVQDTVVAQADQLRKASEIMATVSLEARPDLARPIVRRYAIDMCDAWLTANAPVQAPEEQSDDLPFGEM